MCRGLLTLLLSALLLSARALAQFSTAPVLDTPPNVHYPPIAEAAHISGDVTVSFAINPDGTTTSVQLVTGEPMLAGAVVETIKKWRFKTPLPLNAQTYFEAKYSFNIKAEDDDEEDSLERPPYIPCCGDSIIVKSPESMLTGGDVRSTDGSQVIDVTAPAIAKAEDRCPKDPQKTPPNKTDFFDYVELFTPDYRVRVYRNGRVSWHGIHAVAASGDREALIDATAADGLVTSFQSEDVWAACSVSLPPDPPPDPKTRAKADSEDDPSGIFLTASIGGRAKSVTGGSVSDDYEWAIDRTADTHRWRHADPAAEPYDNMYDDLETPKPGITLLIRATRHFNPYTGQQTFTYLDKLLKRGEAVDAADASGWTALMYASYFDSYLSSSKDGDPVKLLLDARADPNRASLHGDTALMFAAYRGALLQPLLAHGANINAHNADGVTALMLLAQSRKPDDLKDALAAGADANALDNLGRTALDYLRAASCFKPIIPLPRSRGTVMFTMPVSPPCPADTPKFKQFEALLEAAMKAASAR